MIRLLKYLKWYYIPMIIAIVGFIYLQVTFDLMLPEKMQEVIQIIGREGTIAEIIQIGLLMLMYTMLSVVCSVSVGFISARIAAGFSHRVREKVYEKIDSFSMEEMNDFTTSSLITRTTNDVQQVQMVVVMMLRMAITAPIMATKAVIKIWEFSGQISIVVAFAVLFIVVLILGIFVYVLPRFQKIQTQTDDLNLVTRENLTGLRVVRAYNAEKYQENKFEEVNKELTYTHLVVNRAMSLMQPGMNLAMNGVHLGVVWLGAVLISQGALGNTPFEGLGAMLAFTSYGSQIIMSFMMLTFLFVMIPRGSVSGKRIWAVLSTKNKIVEPKVSKEPLEVGTVEFKDVSFRYPGASAAVLEGISFKVQKGETVAFIGSTGSGKSTIINLIPRFYEATSGEILVDGVNVKDYRLEDLNRLLGFVPQKGILFTGSVESNLRIGKEDATEEEMLEALRISQAEEFVFSHEEGLQYSIAQGGRNVSGGQKQRLCIARAIIKDPEIYIFDDSFSALDYRTDRVLRKTLKEKTSSATNLIVAQRIGTILNADKIIVLDKGRVVAIGTHHELLQTSDVYREMAISQLSKEELDYAI